MTIEFKLIALEDASKTAQKAAIASADAENSRSKGYFGRLNPLSEKVEPAVVAGEMTGKHGEIIKVECSGFKRSVDDSIAASDMTLTSPYQDDPLSHRIFPVVDIHFNQVGPHKGEVAQSSNNALNTFTNGVMLIEEKKIEARLQTALAQATNLNHTPREKELGNAPALQSTPAAGIDRSSGFSLA